MGNPIKFSVFSFFTVMMLLGGQDLQAACDCTVTSADGSGKETGACTIHKVIGDGGCKEVTIAGSLSGKTILLDVGIPLDKITLKGPVDENGKPTVTLLYGNATSPMLIQMTGGAALRHLIVSSPGKTAVQVKGDNNTIENVVIAGTATTKNKVGIEFLSGKTLIVAGGEVRDNATGILFQKDTSIMYVVKSTAGIRPEFYHNTVALQLSGQTSLTEGAIIRDNDSGAIIEGQGNILMESEFFGNKVEGILLKGGANGGILPPELVRVLTNTADPGKLSLLVRAPATVGQVQAFVADSNVAAAQGKSYLKNAPAKVFVAPVWSGSTDKLFVVDLSGQKPELRVTLTAVNGSGTSTFSKPVVIGTQVVATADPAICGGSEWFAALAANGKNPWDENSDKDLVKNGQEDTNRNCKVDADETDPVKDDFNIYFVNLCLLYPGTCSFANNCLQNPDSCKFGTPKSLDMDGDKVADEKDHCPMVADIDQKDTDGDGLGDICDPDADNDGLTNKYCDPNQLATNAATCVMIGVDQEGAVNSIPDPKSGEVKVYNLDTLKADSDNDGYCDGPGWGKIYFDAQKGQYVSICLPSDNCPRINNAGQWDTDEDGTGDACDASPFMANALSDSDADGVQDYTASGQNMDNCPWIANKDQKDTDGDGRGDVCDSDDDNDGLLDVVENSTRYKIADNTDPKNLKISYIILNPLSSESDATDDKPKGDGVPDAGDKCPVSQFGGPADTCDKIPGSSLVYTLNDNPADDCPAVRNLGIKAANGTDAACALDFDNDGVINQDEDGKHTHFWEADSDHYKFDDLKKQAMGADGLSDKDDICPANYSPGNADICHNKAAEADTDKDGKLDVKDNCPMIANPDQNDMDKEGVGDACDDDIDGDGVKNDGDKCPKNADLSCSENLPPPGDGETGGSNTGGGLSGPPAPAVLGGGGCSLVAGSAGTSSVGLGFMAFVTLLMVRRMRNA